MLESGPFNPFVYWPHVVLGISSVFFAAIAIGSRKGSKQHRQSGWVFAVAMSVAAITAIAFSFVRFAPAAIFSSAVVLYGTGMAILTLRRREGALRLAQATIAIVPIAIALAALAAAAAAVLIPPPPDLGVSLAMQLAVGGLALAVAILFAGLAIGDFRFLRAAQPSKARHYRRHALRMALAVTEVLRAPLISFGPPLGAEGLLSFPVYFFGPFLLIPAIYFLAMPDWLKSGNRDGNSPMSVFVAE
jgi:hypothetical protein